VTFYGGECKQLNRRFATDFAGFRRAKNNYNLIPCFGEVDLNLMRCDKKELNIIQQKQKMVNIL